MVARMQPERTPIVKTRSVIGVVLQSRSPDQGHLGLLPIDDMPRNACWSWRETVSSQC